MGLIEWLKVGQRWKDMLDGEVVTITLIEPHVAYPVQYRYESGHLGRDTVEGFIRTNLPLPDLAAFLSVSALRKGQEGKEPKSDSALATTPATPGGARR